MIHISAMSRLLYLVPLCLLVAALTPCASPQQRKPSLPPPFEIPPMVSTIPPGSDPLMGPINAQMAFKRNLARQKTIIRQSRQLLALARKLNEDLARPRSNQASGVVVKEAAEIKKLAGSIRSKMCNGY